MKRGIAGAAQKASIAFPARRCFGAAQVAVVYRKRALKFRMVSLTDGARITLLRHGGFVPFASDLVEGQETAPAHRGVVVRGAAHCIDRFPVAGIASAPGFPHFLRVGFLPRNGSRLMACLAERREAIGIACVPVHVGHRFFDSAAAAGFRNHGQKGVGVSAWRKASTAD